MEEMRCNSGDLSEYDSYENHKPLIDREFESKLAEPILSRIALGVIVALVLIANDHEWWAAAAGVLAIVASFGTVMERRANRVRVFKEGVLADEFKTPGTQRSWKQLPWSAILHLDLSKGSFKIATTKNSSFYNSIYTYLDKMERAEKTKLINELKSLQQRGDIPSTVRIVE